MSPLSNYNIGELLEYVLRFLPHPTEIRYLNLVDFKKDQRTNPLVRLCLTGYTMKSCVPSACAHKLNTNDRNTIGDVIKSIPSGKIDLLYIDHGINDFWYLKMVLEYHQPSIICVSYNPYIPFEKSVTAPYQQSRDQHDAYAQSSLKALCAILPCYMLWACLDDNCAFFVSDQIGQVIPKVESRIMFYPAQWKGIAHKFWVNVRSK